MQTGSINCYRNTRLEQPRQSVTLCCWACLATENIRIYYTMNGASIKMTSAVAECNIMLRVWANTVRVQNQITNTKAMQSWQKANFIVSMPELELIDHEYDITNCINPIPIMPLVCNAAKVPWSTNSQRWGQMHVHEISVGGKQTEPQHCLKQKRNRKDQHKHRQNTFSGENSKTSITLQIQQIFNYQRAVFGSGCLALSFCLWM